MNIINVTRGADTGNQSYLLSKAINDYTPHHSMSCTHPSCLDFRYDVLWREQWGNSSSDGLVPRWLRNAWMQADVLHIHNAYKRANYWASYRKDVGIVFQQHGRHPNDQDRLREICEQRHAVHVVSTLNLLEIVDWDIKRWFPAPIELFPAKRVRRQGEGPVRIIQCPTMPDKKATREFVEVTGALKERYDIEAEVVTGVSHLECMVRKARADILFDQLAVCYGGNSLEAWAMGIPVVVGLSPRVHELAEQTFGRAPYVLARTPEELYRALERLIVDVDYRAEMGRVGRDYVATWHSPQRAADIAIATYREAITRGAERFAAESKRG